MMFNVLRYSPVTGFVGAEAVHVDGFEVAKAVAEEAARNQALRGRMLYQYHVVDLDGRVRYRAPPATLSGTSRDLEVFGC